MTLRFVYLAGPIFEAHDPVTWRSYVKANLPEHWQAVDPIEFELNLATPKQIVETDKTAIRSCDVLLAMALEPSWGTAMEIYFARENNVPVIAWLPSAFGVKRFSRTSTWLEHHANLVTSEFSAVLNFLRERTIVMWDT